MVYLNKSINVFEDPRDPSGKKIMVIFRSMYDKYPLKMTKEKAKLIVEHIEAIREFAESKKSKKGVNISDLC